MSREATSKGLAVVTGASSGIGEQLARQLVQRGHPVLAVARRIDRLEALAKELAGAGGTLHPFAADVTEPGAAERIREKANALGGAAWLVNNAGMALFGAFHKVDASRQAAMVRLNCESVVTLCGAFVPDLVARRSGVVLNVASLAGMQPTPFMSAYGATKAFVLSFSEGLSEELRGTGVTVTALCPGPVTSELFEASATDVKRKKPSHEISSEDCARFAIEAAEKGRVVAVPGAMNFVQAVAGRYAPRALVRRVSASRSLPYVGVLPDSVKR